MFVIWIAMTIFLVSMLAKAEYVNSSNGLRVRKRPSTDSEILAVLPYGAEVHGTERAGWLKLDDRDGYVCATYIQDENPSEGREYLGKWRITAYAYTGSPCANGNFPSTGYTIACNSLPFGTQVYIDGVGVRVVEDRGPEGLGSAWCDLYLGDVSDCIVWGDQYRDVWRFE